MNADSLTETDRLIARLVLAGQAESGLDAVDVDRFETQLVEGCRQQGGDYLPRDRDAIHSSIQRLVDLGYLDFDPANPHIAVSLQGFLACAALRIPSEVANALALCLTAEKLA